MKIIFWGTPKYAAENLLSLVESGYEIIAVVTQPDRKRGRGNKLSYSPVKQVSIDCGIPVYETNSIRRDETTKKILLNLNADIYVVVAFGQILPKEILDQPKLGCWNSHASLLPRWRGAAPIQWAIINNDTKTGVSIMEMEEGLDTGSVIEQESLNISETDNLEIMTNKLSLISSKLLAKSLEKIKSSYNYNKKDRKQFLNAKDQCSLKGEISYARQLIKEDYLIEWSQDSRKISRKIKGLYPNAFTFHNKKRLKILEVILITKTEILFKNNNEEYISVINKIKNNVPGKIIYLSKDKGILVMTNDLPVFVKKGQLEGKKITDGFTLSSQLKLSLGDSFGY